MSCRLRQALDKGKCSIFFPKVWNLYTKLPRSSESTHLCDVERSSNGVSVNSHLLDKRLCLRGSIKSFGYSLNRNYLLGQVSSLGEVLCFRGSMRSLDTYSSLGMMAGNLAFLTPKCCKTPTWILHGKITMTVLSEGDRDLHQDPASDIAQTTHKLGQAVRWLHTAAADSWNNPPPCLP